jgi:hypothetical protein
VNDGIDEAVSANVASPSGVVSISVCLLGDVKTSDEGSHRLASFADLHKHVAVNLRKSISRKKHLLIKPNKYFVVSKY